MEEIGGRNAEVGKRQNAESLGQMKKGEKLGSWEGGKVGKGIAHSAEVIEFGNIRLLISECGL